MARSSEAPVFIKDGEKRVPLERRVIDGVTVWTPSTEKSRELDKRFREMVEKVPATKPHAR